MWMLGLICVALFAGFDGSARGQDGNRVKESGERPGVVMIEAVWVALVVDVVDSVKRTVTLKSDDGKE